MPTDTPVPTDTPTPLPLRDEVTVEVGGYAFRPPQRYAVNVYHNTVDIAAYMGDVTIHLLGFTNLPHMCPPADLADCLSGVALDFKQIFAAQPSPASVGGLIGALYPLNGTENGIVYEGELLVLQPAPDAIFLAWGIAYPYQASDRWQNGGKAEFHEVLDSIRFIPYEGICLTALDWSYGYTREFPIAIGGGPEHSPARLLAYMLNLLGPEGEPIIFRLTMENSDEEELKEIEFTYEGAEEMFTLYFDIDNYNMPLAPAGLSCAGPFNLPKFIEPPVEEGITA
jgi:hypothetical protein